MHQPQFLTSQTIYNKIMYDQINDVSYVPGNISGTKEDGVTLSVVMFFKSHITLYSVHS